MARSDELTLIDRFFRPLAGEGAFALADDAACIAPQPGLDQIVTSDMIASGVHFLPGDPPGTIAAKALRVNLSDLASKGADPLAYCLNMAMGPEISDDWLAAFSAGLARDQERFAINLLGGDTISIAGPTMISITAIGLLPAGRMVHRFDARAGDILYVSGTIGAAVAGLSLLTDPGSGFHRMTTGAKEACIARYRLPEPRTALAQALRDHANAAMDVSDGLVGDADKLAGSSGCTGTIIYEDIPLPEGLAGAVDEPAAMMLITGGDDYEILASVPPDRAHAFENAASAAAIPVHRIGMLAAGTDPVQVMKGTRQLALPNRAYVHRDQHQN